MVMIKGRAYLGLGATMLLSCVMHAAGATRNWTGASVTMNGVPHDNLWTNPFNWSGNAAPLPGDDLVFDGGSQLSSVNDFSAGTTFNKLTVRGHTMEGAAIALNAGLSADASEINFSVVKIAQINLAAIKLNNPQTFTAVFSPYTSGVSAIINSAIDNNGNLLTLSGQGFLSVQGPISGTGGVVKSDFGTVQLLADNSYTGVTTLSKGELLVYGSQPASAIQISTPTPQFGEDPTLGGDGTVGPVSFSLGGVIAPGNLNHGTGLLEVTGNLSYPPSNFSGLEIDLKGADAGLGYDQVRTAGEVSLGKLTVLNVFLLNSAFAPAIRQAFTIVRNDSATPVHGIFNGHPEGSYFTVNDTPFVISYKGGDGNDVVLRVPAVWDGGGNDDNWMTAANWRGDVLPIPGDILVFPNSGKRIINVNNFPDGTAFAGIILQDVYRISGNGIVLGEFGLSADVVLAEMPLTLGEPALFQNAGVNSNVYLAGPVNLGSNALTVKVTANGRVSFSGPITGTGEIDKFGGVDGRLDFEASAQTSGNPIKVFNGDLVIFGAHLDSPVFLDPAGTAPVDDIDLTATGSIGPLMVGGATVSAGALKAGAGLLIVNGNATFSGNGSTPATLVVTLAGAMRNNQDKLIVNGIVTLNDPELLVGFNNGFAPPVGSNFVIIANDGVDPVMGTFHSKPEGASFVSGGTTFGISYVGGDGNDVALTVVNATPTPTPAPKLANISTRLRVLDGDNVLIGGMIATGSAPKTVILRAIGPTLTDLGLAGALPDPTLKLFLGNTLVASNDDWRSSTQQAEIENSGFAPGKEAESAMIVSLSPNQNYTAVVRGKDGQTGVAVVEAFDVDELAPAKLANISSRGFVDVDDNAMIAGLIVAPAGAQDIKVLVRALGPTLGDFGVPSFLADPTLDLVNANGSVIRSNDNWKTSQQADIEAAQLAPGHDEEAALIQSLAPGAYTAVVRGIGRSTGVGLVEVYNIQ
jgi:autotransporter-associated beta strand protein